MKWNRRKTAMLLLVLSVVILGGIFLLGLRFKEAAMETDFARTNLPPSMMYLFGTDFLGRDMFSRTIVGLSMSIQMGILTAAVSAMIALVIGVLSATMGKKVDSFLTFLIDLVMGVPHILLLILISFACGKGVVGVSIGIILTHWMSLARVIRGEILQLKQSGYIQVARKLGSSQFQILCKHMMPHLLPQFMTGFILLFPHAILHEASITFLGFGLSPEQPAIGIILSESMKYLVTGNWWLSVFPGVALVFVVFLFDYIGHTLRKLSDPSTIHE